MADPLDVKSLKVNSLKGSALTTAAGQELGDDAKLRLRSQLKNALNAELAVRGDTLGLKPGDKVAISSSVGQSISF